MLGYTNVAIATSYLFPQFSWGEYAPIPSKDGALAKWLLEFLGIPRNKGVNFHGKFGLGIPNHNNSGSKNLEIPRNS